MKTKEELVELYRGSLWTLISHLDNYSYSPEVSRKVHSYARKLEKLKKKKHAYGGMESLLETIHEVDALLKEIYGGIEEFDKMLGLYVDEDDVAFTVEAEAVRLRMSIPELGYRGLFEKFDAERIRKDMTKYSQSTQRGFMHQVRTLSELSGSIPGGGSLDELSKGTTDLMIAMRTIERVAPVPFELEQRQLLAQCYNSIVLGRVMAAQYVEVMETVSGHLDRVLELCGVSAPNPHRFRNQKVADYLVWREAESERMQRLYVELKYQLILRVV